MKQNRRMSRTLTRGIIAVGAVAGMALAGAGPAFAASSPGTPPGGQAPVAQGIGSAALSRLAVFGNTAPDTPETVSFVMTMRSMSQLEQQVNDGMPGGYLSVGQFARQYGQTPGHIRQLERYLQGFGIQTNAYPDGLDVSATGTAGQFDQALSVKQHNYWVPGRPARNGHPAKPGKTIHGTTDQALLPRQLARYVTAVLGITDYPSYTSDAVHTLPLKPGVKPAVQYNGTQTALDFAKQYNLTPLQKRGATGAGRTIGIVTLASLNPADPEYYWNNVLHISTKANRIRLVNIDGGSGAVSAALGSDETTLDVEQSGALAPQANIVVYQGPNTDPGFLDGFFRAASDNIADTVSTSWGESETAIQAAVKSGQESKGYATSFDEAFLEMGAQGQSAFASSGDQAAYDATADIGTTNLATDSPASSPWVTAAGGSTLAGTIPLAQGAATATIGAQRTWGWDWLWPYWSLFAQPNGAPYPSEAAYVAANTVGSGGGFSSMEPMPGYQRQVSGVNHFNFVQYLTPTDYQNVDGLTLPTSSTFNPTPTVQSGSGNGRAVPDVVANADPYTGYYIYFSEFTAEGDPALYPGWGGTSFVAPQLNGSTALIDSYLGRRVGFWNPSVYKFATSGNSPFTPLDTAGTSNDNLYYTGTPGQRYNPGSGLGTPDLAALANDFGSSGRHGR